MKIDVGEVQRIAELAHLELAPEELASMQRELAAILEYVALLDRLPTEGIEPMSHAADPGADASALRADAVQPSLGAAAALANAPLAAGACFQVPRVIER